MDNKLLEVLHRKIRELGTDKFKELMPDMHSNKFNSIIAGVNPVPDDMKAKALELWPADFKDEAPAPTQEIPGNIGVNQLNFAILSPILKNYDHGNMACQLGLVRRTGCGWFKRPEDADIYRTRNYLAAAFLKSDYEWSLWLDSDIIAPNGNLGWFRQELGGSPATPNEYLGIIAPYQLVSHGKFIVSAVYFSKDDKGNILVGYNPNTSLKSKLPCRQLLPIRYCGFGCVMIHRKVYEDILKKHPELWDGKSDECQVFSPYYQDGRIPGEDEVFCVRAKEVGHDTFLDLSVVAGHAGRKVYYIPDNLRT